MCLSAGPGTASLESVASHDPPIKDFAVVSLP